jgi:hypothetical protein
MAFFGNAEKRNLHGLLCIPVLPKSLAGTVPYCPPNAISLAIKRFAIKKDLNLTKMSLLYNKALV